MKQMCVSVQKLTCMGQNLCFKAEVRLAFLRQARDTSVLHLDHRYRSLSYVKKMSKKSCL